MIDRHGVAYNDRMKLPARGTLARGQHRRRSHAAPYPQGQEDAERGGSQEAVRPEVG